MHLCIDLAEMLEARAGAVTFHQKGLPVLHIRRQDEGDGWLVIDCGSERRLVEDHSFDAALAAHQLLGADARRVLLPVLSGWRYGQMFPLGSSLEWAPAPLSSWAPPKRLMLPRPSRSLERLAV